MASLTRDAREDSLWVAAFGTSGKRSGHTSSSAGRPAASEPEKTPVQVKLNLDNITNQKQIIFDNGTDAAGNLLYFRLTGFSAYASLTVPVSF